MKKVLKQIISNSEEETKNAGRWLGRLLKPGDVICLVGELGTGKTAFTKGIAEALGIQEIITSPTFTIVNEYKGGSKLHHFDVYRVNDPDELYNIGFEEYVYSDAVVVIEWADLISDIIPDERIWITFSRDAQGENRRNIIISFQGKRFENRFMPLT